jgi:regulator of cell morphogenesis and NO signaling
MQNIYLPFNKSKTSKMMHDFDRPVDEIVKTDYRTAEVFKKYGINYCCAAQVALQSVCSENKIDMVQVREDLDLATRDIRIPNSLHFDEWKMDFLVDFIINIHHHYIYNTIPSLGPALQSFAFGHSKKYPEILNVSALFDKLSAILLLHTRHEDEIIFPYIKQIDSAHRRKETYGNLFVRTLRKPLSIVEKEHLQIQELLDELRKISNFFTYPENACTNYQVFYHKLEEFYNNLIQHKFLENNILFPKAIAIEQQLLQK